VSTTEVRQQALIEAATPVRPIPGDEQDRQPAARVALCLSGGGFRAMLFHVGALWRLNELGWLKKLERVSSVSGGSITAGVLARPLGRPHLRRRRRGDELRRRARRSDSRVRGTNGRHRSGSEGRVPAGVDRGPRRKLLRRAPLRRRNATGHPRRSAALRFQREKPPVPCALALLEEAHVRLPRWEDREPPTSARGRGRRLVRVPIVPVAADAEAQRRRREGAYWSIWSETADFGLPDPLDCPDDSTKKLAAMPTRLGKTDSLSQSRLINWGYAICDTAMRKHVLPGAPRPAGFPYPEAGV
jgi:Patatin-like phospholipase